MCGRSEVKVIGLIKKLYVYARGKVFHNGMSRRIVAAAALLGLKCGRRALGAYVNKRKQKKKSRPNECNPS